MVLAGVNYTVGTQQDRAFYREQQWKQVSTKSSTASIKVKISLTFKSQASWQGQKLIKSILFLIICHFRLDYYTVKVWARRV